MTDAPAPDFSAFLQAAQDAFQARKFLLCLSLLDAARAHATHAQNAAISNQGEISNGDD